MFVMKRELISLYAIAGISVLTVVQLISSLPMTMILLMG